jgi:hypothetical protein
MAGLEERTVLAVALAFQVSDADEAQGGGVDAVAQPAGLPGPVVEHVARWLPPWAERTSVRTIRWLKSRCSTTLPGSIGTVKLGHPVPLSNLVIEANNGSPDTTST